jgi:hypothetical protein
MPKKMNSQKESIFSNHSAPKKMNNSEESILAGQARRPIVFVFSRSSEHFVVYLLGKLPNILPNLTLSTADYLTCYHLITAKKLFRNQSMSANLTRIPGNWRHFSKDNINISIVISHHSTRTKPENPNNYPKE